jgi:hypothetical protein
MAPDCQIAINTQIILIDAIVDLIWIKLMSENARIENR